MQCESSILWLCSWPQVADGTQTPDGGHWDGCCLHLLVDGQPSPHPGLDQTRLQCGMATSSLFTNMAHHLFCHPYISNITHGFLSWPVNGWYFCKTVAVLLMANG